VHERCNLGAILDPAATNCQLKRRHVDSITAALDDAFELETAGSDSRSVLSDHPETALFHGVFSHFNTIVVDKSCQSPGKLRRRDVFFEQTAET
jgi:hypothetical protein